MLRLYSLLRCILGRPLAVLLVKGKLRKEARLELYCNIQCVVPVCLCACLRVYASVLRLLFRVA